VKRDPNGDVWIDGVPMVDQGPKGYCVVASAQRLFEYYGISCDEHQLAQMAGTQAQGGTSSTQMEKALQSLDTNFRMHFKAVKRNGPAEFHKQIQDYVNKGIPLLWGLEVGKYPEVPPLKAHGVGGHMRLIIGYNLKEGDVIFTDSWGAGHEKERMKVGDAFNATHGLYVMQPTTY
jgi:hypothetical protein